MTFDPDFSALLGDFDPSTPPPRVLPVDPGARRPRWSVMIPTFNCASFLRKTLESVLAQDPGPKEMQIEVIDDCSTKDDPESVVKEVGGGRVSFKRKECNEGAVPNFNTCIDRSRGELVHILHGDDYVLPGFYDEIEKKALERPECALLATRSFLIDEASIVTGVTERITELEDGGNHSKRFLVGTPIQFAGVVTRRQFFENNGGFRKSLIHCADWEMWIRAITLGGGVISPEVLACYRVFEGNDTSRLVQSGENLRDILRGHLARHHDEKSYPLEEALNRFLSRALQQAHRQQVSGNLAAAAAAKEIAAAVRVNLPKPSRDLAWFLGGLSNLLGRMAAVSRPQ